MQKAGEIARRLKVHPNTIRNWADRYARFMSAEAVPGSANAKREFTQEDALVLATIAQLQQQGLRSEQIEEALEAGRRADDVPALPTPEEETARESVALVLRSEYEHALDRVRELSDERARLIDERNAALLARDADVAALNLKIAVLEREIGTVQGQLSERLPMRTVLQIIVLALVGMLIVLAVVIVVLSRGA